MTTRITNKELAQRFSDLEELFRKMTEKKPSKVRQFWNWTKPHFIPFTFGVVVGVLSAAVCGLPSAASPATLKQQAVQGGTVIPFQSGLPSPSLSKTPPGNSMADSTADSWTKISEPPLPANPQADNGQTNSQKSFRRTTLRTH